MAEVSIVYVVRHSVTHEGEQLISIHSTEKGAIKFIEETIDKEKRIFHKTFYRRPDNRWVYDDQTYAIDSVVVRP